MSAASLQNTTWEGTFTTGDGTGTLRFTFGSQGTRSGYAFVPVASAEASLNGTHFQMNTGGSNGMTCGDPSDCGSFRLDFEDVDLGGYNVIDAFFILNRSDTGAEVTATKLTGTAQTRPIGQMAPGTWEVTRQ